MTISCEQCREWLSDLLEDEAQAPPQFDARLPQPAADPSTNGTNASHAPTHAVLLAHLATCADCACDLNMLRTLRSELRLLPQQAAPADLRAKVRAQLEAAPARLPLIAPPLTGVEHLNQVSATNGNHRLAPHYTPAQPSFITSLTRFFSRHANLAWASSVALAGFCLVLFTREQPHLVMPTAGGSAATPMAIVPKVSKKGHSNEAASAPDKKVAVAAAKPQPENLAVNDTFPVLDAPDAALTTPPASVSGSSEPTDTRHGHARHGLTTPDSGVTRPAAKYQGISPAISPHNNQAHQDKASGVINPAGGNTALAGSAAPTPAPKSDKNPQNNTLATPPVMGESNGTGGVATQASDANPPFARLTLFAANGATSKTNSTQSPNPIAPGPTGPLGTDNVETSAPAHDSAPSMHGSSRIAVRPGGPHAMDAPPRPQYLAPGKVTSEPPANFGLVGDERAAHLVVVPARDIKAAQLDITLSSGLRYADQTNGERRTVWHGAAQQGHPITVDLHVVATDSGTQQVKVALMEVSPSAATGESEDAKLAQNATLNLNVTTPDNTTP